MDSDQHEHEPSGLPEEMARRLESLGVSLRASFLAMGRGFYSTIDEQGRVVYRDLRSDEEWTPAAVRAWRAGQGPDTGLNTPRSS